MALTDQKILDSDITTYGVQSQPNKLTGSAQQNKQAFDKLIAEVVKVKLNALIDELTALTAAEQIGVDIQGLTSTNVEDAIAELLQNMQDITQGGVTDGAITTAKLATGAVTEIKLADEAVTADKLSGILPENVGIKSGTEVPTTDDLDPGEIYLKYTV